MAKDVAERSARTLRSDSQLCLLSKRCSGRVSLIVVSIFFLCVESPWLSAQSIPAQSPEKRQEIADRFFEVLLRRPSPGTALDRVYGHHVQNGSLDSFLTSLDVTSDASEAGQKQFVLGLIQSRRNHVADAIVAFKKAESWLPKDANVSFELAKALMADGERAAAIAALGRAIEREPDRRTITEVYATLGRLYLHSGSRQQAVDTWNQLIQRNPDDLATNEKVAQWLSDAQQYEEALELMERLQILAKSDEAKIRYQIQAAELKASLGKTEQARAEFRQLINRLRPGSWLYRDVRRRFERSFVSSGDYDALAAYYTEQTKRSPDDLSSLVRLGQILASIGKSEQAEQAYRKSLKLSPAHAGARLSLIDLLLASQRPRLAAEQIEVLLENDPGNPDYLMRLGDVRLRDSSVPVERRRTNAAASWNRLAATKADDALTLTSVAAKMESIQFSDTAIELYQQAIVCDPDSSQHRENLGRCLFRLQRRDEAIAVWRTIASEERLNLDSLLRLAEVFRSHELDDLELETWKRAAQMDLSLDQRLRFVRVLIKADDFDRALSEIEDAETLVLDEQGREKLLAQRVKSIFAAGRLDRTIGQLSLKESSAENQRFLALLLHADHQYNAASLAIETARELAPDDNWILQDAARIAESAGHLELAAEQLTELIQRNPRGKAAYLRKRIHLQERLNDPEAALESARQLVDVTPTSSDAYETFARIAFALGKSEQGEKMLRRAIVASPRSIGVRVDLAERLAERFETSEAIELIWQAIESDPHSSSRNELVRKLVPLYARRGEIVQLVSRISRMDAERLDEKSKQILAAVVWSSVKDYRQAQLTLNQALSHYPHDVGLLAEMVDSLLESGSLKSAAEYQRRITELEASPDNKRRLREIELSAGVITEIEALTQEIQETDDPKRLASIACRNAGRDPEQSAELCRLVLDKNPSLWDLKIVRSQLLLLSDSPSRHNDLAEAIRIAGEVESMELDDDSAALSLGRTGALPRISTATSPTVITRGSAVPIGVVNLRAQQLSRLKSTYQSRSPYFFGTTPSHPKASSFPQSAARSILTIQQLNRRRVESRRNNGTKSYSFQYGMNYVSPSTYYQAKWIAVCIKIIASTQLSKMNDASLMAEGSVERLYPPPESTSKDLGRLHDALMIDKLIEMLTSKMVPRKNAVVWRIAELTPEENHPDLTLILQQRMSQRKVSDEVIRIEANPLSDRQIEILAKLCLTHQELALSRSRSIDDIMIDLEMRRMLMAECRLAEKEFPLAKSPSLQSRRAGFNEALAEIQSALWQDDVDTAGELVQSLASAARNRRSSTVLADASITWLASPSNESEIKFVLKHRDALIDAWIAHCSQSMVANQVALTPSEIVWGTPVQIVVPRLTPGLAKPQYKIFRLETPLSKRILDERLVRGLVPLVPTESSAKSSRLAFRMDNQLSQRLSRPLDGATPYEQKLRFLIAAFSAWWDGRPEDCYLQLRSLAKKYPDDLDLQLETARLALTCGRESEAFTRIDHLNPSDNASRVQVEIARIVLAAKAGKNDVVRSTAQKLLSQPIAPGTRAFLARQLRDTASKNQTVSSVRQAISAQPKLRSVSKTSVVNDDKKKIELAKKLLESGDTMTASEIAYSVINRYQNARKVQRTKVRQQAIEILTSTGRLRPLIESTERKFKSSSGSEAYREELADLYVAAGQGEKASLLWKEVIRKLNLSPRQITRRASTLRGQREYHQAAILYLYAFEADPEQWNSHWHVFLDSASLSTSQDLLFEFLCGMDIRSFRFDTLCSVIRLRGETSFSDAQRKFASHVLSTHPDRHSHLPSVLSAIPDSEKGHLPEIRALVVNAVTDESIFNTDSPLWGLTHWTEKGIVTGVLDDFLNLLWSDNKTGKQFETLAKKRTKSPVAQILLATYQLKHQATRDSAIQEIKTLCPSTMTEHHPVLRETQLPAGLLWQIGQLIDSMDSLEDQALVKTGVFQTALAATDTLRPSASNHAHPQDQLYHAYIEVGHPELARRGLLDRFENASFPRTTGIRENRKLQLATHVSEQLIEAGFPIDGARICRQVLNQPVLFQLARRYARGINHKVNLDSIHHKATLAMNEATAESYFNEIRFRLVEGTQAAIDLGTIESATTMDAMPNCLFCDAVGKAAKTNTGRQSLRSLFDLLVERTATKDQDTSFHLSQLVLAAEISPDDLERLLSALSENVMVDQTSLIEIIAILSAIRDKVPEELDPHFEEVVTWAQTSFSKPPNQEAMIALAKLSRAPNSIRLVLNSIEQRAGDAPPVLEDLLNCLQLADRLAKTGEWSLAIRAIQVALGRGPPLISPSVSTRVADPYGGSVPTHLPTTQSDLLRSIQSRLVKVLSRVRDSSNRPVTSLAFDASTCNLPENILPVFDRTLRQIIFPSEKFVNVYAYQSPIGFSKDDLVVGSESFSESIVYAACNIAKSSKTTDSLISKIKECINLSQTPGIASTYVDISIACGSPSQIDDALVALHGAVDDRLPLPLSGDLSGDLSATIGGDPQSVPRPKPPSGQAAILTLAEKILPVVWPVFENDDISQESRAIALGLLNRTLILLKSDVELASKHSDWFKQIERRSKSFRR